MSTEIHALAGAYALDAVSDLERAEFARHLTDCESCALEVAELRATAARLADSTWSAAPPRLRENVLREVSRTRQVRPGKPGRHGAESSAPPGRRHRRMLAVAAAAVLVVGAGAASVALEERRVRDARTQAQATQDQMARVQAVLTAADAGARQVVVRGGGRLSLIFSPSQDTGVVMLAGLARPGTDKAYQLWVMDDPTRPTSADVLPAGRDAGMSLVSGVRGAQAVALSLEPAGGSARPTDQVAMVSLS